MSTMIPPILNAMTIGLIVMMLYQGLKRQVELLSYRNIYLVGFIMFQLSSGASVMSMTDYDIVPIEHPKQAANLFLVYCIIFLVVYLCSHHWLRLVDPLVRWFKPKQPVEASDWMLLMVGIGFAVFAVIMRYVVSGIPVFHLFDRLAPLAAVPCCLVGWVWGGRRFNVVVLATGGVLVLLCVFLSLHGYVSRRYIISACLALAWGAWYRQSHQVSLAKLIAWVIPVMLVMGVVVGAWNSVRYMVFQGEDSSKAIAALRTTTLSRSIEGLNDRAEEAGITLWALDAFPDRHEQRHLFTFKYMLYHPIPRVLWENKPTTLSNQVSRLADVKGVNHDVITLTPCVLGHAQAEGGLYALLLYALFFGQLTRFFDVLVRSNPGNPFIIVATGCTLGQLVALVRGDLSIFTNYIVLGFLIVWSMLLVARLFIGKNSRSPTPTFAPPRQ